MINFFNIFDKEKSRACNINFSIVLSLSLEECLLLKLKEKNIGILLRLTVYFNFLLFRSFLNKDTLIICLSIFSFCRRKRMKSCLFEKIALCELICNLIRTRPWTKKESVVSFKYKGWYIDFQYRCSLYSCVSIYLGKVFLTSVSLSCMK